MDIDSFLIHGPSDPDPFFHAVVPPLYLSTAFRLPKEGRPGEFIYARGKNPLRVYFEALVADLEGGKYAFAFASGQAASAAALSVLKAGSKVLVTRNVYGGTLELLENFYQDFGLEFDLVDTTDIDGMEYRIDEKTKAVFIETPSNPLLDVTDIAAVSTVAKKHGIITIVDNTFLSPYFQRPLLLGADIVVESATKFLSGHSDVIAGILAVNDAGLAAKIGTFQKIGGAISQPFDIYLLLRSLKTLSVRLERQQRNTAAILEYIKNCPAVDKIFYPGLPEHPGYEIQKAQAGSPGTIISFELNRAYDISGFFDSLELITPGPSLGSVESLIQNPATGSHSSFTPEQRLKAGIKDNLLRFSAGIEDVSDIIGDFSRALEKAKKG
jgi:cystathionine beta-lyase